MAKRINILGAGPAVPFADGGLKLSKSIKISEIEEHPDFKSLFKIDDELLKRITNSIDDDGFDNSQPVHIWKVTEVDGTVHYYLIDGYTRIKALKQLEYETVPYFEHNFKTFEEAYKYVLGLQVNRRNLESSELLRNVSRLLGTDFVQNAEGKKSEIIAEVLGVSDRTVEKAISVSENADEETLAKIESGELSVNKAYKQEKAKKKSERNVLPEEEELPPPFPEMEGIMSDDADDISDALEENDGNPGSITVRSRDMSEYYNPPEEDEFDKRLIERYKEGFVCGLKKGFSEGSYQVYDKIITMLHEGKTVEEIENDDLFSDFTFSVIAPKLEIATDDEELLKEFNT